MEVENSSLLFLQEEILKIPYYQRSYVWTEENWKKLVNNLTNDDSLHFIGSIILQKTEDDDYFIIDGQQRLTTISVLIKACTNKVSDNTNALCALFHAEGRHTNPEISKDNLSLRVNHSIEKDYQKIMLDTYPYDNSEFEYDENQSKIVNCYRYFCGKIRNENDELVDVISNADADKILKLLLKEKIKNTKDGCVVKIILNVEDDAQRIFDTINAEGVRLTSVDIIKNKLFDSYSKLLIADGRDKEDAYNTYIEHWEPIFEDKSIKYWESKILKLFSYIGTIYKIYDQNKYNENDLDKVYKDYIEKIDSSSKMESFIQDILNIAMIFKQYIDLDENKEIKWSDKKTLNVFILNSLGENTLFPYVIKTYQKYVDVIELDSIDDESVIKIHNDSDLCSDLEKISSTAIRFAICENACKKIKNFNKKIFGVIDSEIDDFANNLAKDENGNDADLSDTNFANGLNNIPKSNNSYAKLVLFLVEIYRRSTSGKSPKDPMKYDAYSLEHIIAQEYETNWSVEDHPVYSVKDDHHFEIMNEKYAATQIRKAAIYRIGNMLLLTGPQNSSVSNKYIADKIDESSNRNTGKKKDRWVSYRTCNSLSITGEVVHIYNKNKESIGTEGGRKENELWDERDVEDRTKRLKEEILSLF